MRAPAGAGFGGQHRHYSETHFLYQTHWRHLRGVSTPFQAVLQGLLIIAGFAPNIRPSLSTRVVNRHR